jgi:hypothetical protein
LDKNNDIHIDNKIPTLKLKANITLQLENNGLYVDTKL